MMWMDMQGRCLQIVLFIAVTAFPIPLVSAQDAKSPATSKPTKPAFRGTLQPTPPVPEPVRSGTGVQRFVALRPDYRLFDAKAAAAFRKAAAPTFDTDFLLFPQVAIRVRWTAVEPTPDHKGWSWTGTVPGFINSHAVLLATGPVWTGNLARGDGLLYQIRTLDSPRTPVVWAIEVNQNAFQPRERPQAVPHVRVPGPHELFFLRSPLTRKASLAGGPFPLGMNRAATASAPPGLVNLAGVPKRRLRHFSTTTRSGWRG
jgi:hypothetical protein